MFSLQVSKTHWSIRLFSLLSLAAVIGTCLIFLFTIRGLQERKDIVSFCEQLLHWMFLITATYVFVYVLIVIFYRLHRKQSNLEIGSYIIYAMVMVALMIVAMAVRFDFVSSALGLSNGARLTWPSATLAALLLLFDLMIVLNPSFRKSDNLNDKFWYQIFCEAFKLDLAILIGFALILYLLLILDEPSGDHWPERLTTFIAGSEIMLFLASVCVFAIEAIALFFRAARIAQASN
jgi:hypothetical protein